jgi:hypothetical protein
MAFAYGGDIYKDTWIATKSFYSNKLIDMLPRSHPLLSKIAGNNNVKAKALKGKRFVEPILARTIDNVQGIGYREKITTDFANLLEVIEVEPKLQYQGVTVNDKEISINSTDEIVNLLSINHRAVREGFARHFAKTIYESGAPVGLDPAYAMNGLAYMISENPYLDGLVVYNLMRGGKPGEGNEFWRNRAGEWVTDNTTPGNNSPLWPGTKTVENKDQSARMLVDSMTMMLLVLNGVSEVSSLEKMEPVVDGIYMNYFFYNLFQYARYQLLHINNVADQKIDLGFVKLEHMGVPVYLDKNCPMDRIYFVDSSQIDLLYVPGENFKQEVKEMTHHFAKRYITSFLGNYIIHKARNCGVISLNGTTNGLPLDCNVCNPEVFVDYDYATANTSGFKDKLEVSGYSGSGEPSKAPEPQTEVARQIKRETPKNK